MPAGVNRRPLNIILVRGESPTGAGWTGAQIPGASENQNPPRREMVGREPSAPLAVREDVKAAFALLLQRPGVGVKVGNTPLSGVRRLHLGRVRYFVYYRVKGDALVVLSAWHSSRQAGPSL